MAASSSNSQTSISVNELQQAKCEECAELLSTAGYFRCRMKSLDDFDRIIGGIVWCIYRCGVVLDVDILYEENSSIKQKITITEVICYALIKLNCPIRLEPHQFQGLDFISIYPVVTWLVTKTLEHEKNNSRNSKFFQWFADYSEKISETTAEDIQRAKEDFTERLRDSDFSDESTPSRKMKRVHKQIWKLNRDAQCTLAEYVKELREESSLVKEEDDEKKEEDLEKSNAKKHVPTSTVRKMMDEAIVELYKDESSKDKEDRQKLEKILETLDLKKKIEKLERRIESDAIEYLEAKEENERLSKTWNKVQTAIENSADDDAEKITTLLEMFTSAKERSKELRAATMKTLTEIEDKIIKARLNLDIETGIPMKYDVQMRDAIETLELKRNQRCGYAIEVAHHQRKLDEALTATLKAQYHKRIMEQANNMLDLNRKTKNMMLEYNSDVDILQLSSKCQEFTNKVEEQISENAMNNEYREAFINYMTDVRAQLSEYQWKAKLTQDNLIREKRKLANIRNAIKMKHREMIEKAKYLESIVKVNQQLKEYCKLLDLMSAD